jgi:hypothetical protein
LSPRRQSPPPAVNDMLLSRIDFARTRQTRAWYTRRRRAISTLPLRRHCMPDSGLRSKAFAEWPVLAAQSFARRRRPRLVSASIRYFEPASLEVTERRRRPRTHAHRRVSPHNRPLALIPRFCNIHFGTVNAGEGRYRFLPRFLLIVAGARARLPHSEIAI